MFLDYMLEGSNNSFSNRNVVISEATQREVNNLEVPDYSYDDYTPFEIVERSIKEFAEDNIGMFNSIANAELAYLRENGTEPIWESSDVDSIWGRFIEFVKSIISKITGAFKKLIDTVNKKINELIKKRINKLADNLAKLTSEELDKFIDKTTNIKLYHTELALGALNGMKDVKTIINQTSLKNALAMVDSRDSKYNIGDSYESSDKSSVAEEIRQKLLSGLFAKSGGRVDTKDLDYKSNGSISKAIDKYFCEKKLAIGADLLEELAVFEEDPRGLKLKKDLKESYDSTKKTLSVIIDNAKNYKKTLTKGNDDSNKRSKATALLIDGLNVYTNTVTTVYNKATRAMTARWFQAVRLYFVINSNMRKVKTKKKDEKK